VCGVIVERWWQALVATKKRLGSRKKVVIQGQQGKKKSDRIYVESSLSSRDTRDTRPILDTLVDAVITRGNWRFEINF
jgi:hypothetical protein